MTTHRPRINVTFEQSTVGLLSSLARKNHQSLASLVRELTLEALERHEDLHFSQLAKKLDKKGAKTVSHDDAWN